MEGNETEGKGTERKGPQERESLQGVLALDGRGRRIGEETLMTQEN